jgi:hypothetical protein
MSRPVNGKPHPAVTRRSGEWRSPPARTGPIGPAAASTADADPLYMCGLADAFLTLGHWGGRLGWALLAAFALFVLLRVTGPF